MKNVSIILACLTSEEMQAFHTARVPYSGSTGAGATEQSHGNLAPYIATDIAELRNATRAMGWNDVFIEINSADQWIVRRSRYAGTNYVANHEVYPTRVEFDNGRVVGIAYEEGRVFLTVGKKEQ